MNVYTSPIILKYFTISNRIEGIDDLEEAKDQTEFFFETLAVPDEQAMYLFHLKLNHLNDYCEPGVLRGYDVFVGGKKCMRPEFIESALESLFNITPDTERTIQAWHVRFEKIHPFGDGNGRVGRFLMLRHIWNANKEIPFLLRDDTNFESNRQFYYSWFNS